MPIPLEHLFPMPDEVINELSDPENLQVTERTAEDFGVLPFADSDFSQFNLMDND